MGVTAGPPRPELLSEPHILLRFVDAPGFVTSAIDWVEDGLWPHVEAGTPEGTWIGAHAGTGVQERPAGYCLPRRERRYAVACGAEQATAFLVGCRAAIGVPYNYADITGLLFHLRSLSARHRLICSQFMMRETWAAGVRMLNVLPGYDHLVTPETLHLSPLLIGRCVYELGC